MDQYDDVIRQAAEMGAEAGRAAGSWVLDDNSSAKEARWILQGYDNGDPEVMDLEPSPLSGEWADSPTPQSLARDLDIDEQGYAIDECCSAYEVAFTESFWDEVLRSAKVYAS